MKKFLLIMLVAVFFLTLSGGAILAQSNLLSDSTKQMGDFGNASYGQKEAPYLPFLIGRIIQVVLSILGIILVILIVRSGYRYMTAGGEVKKVDDAKKEITNAVVGLVLCIAAYAISAYVVHAITTATYLKNE